ncbi:MAG: phytanoyl-CoA dioxygenase family protein [Acidimicrobiales bacterium]
MTAEQPIRDLTETEITSLHDDGVICVRQILPHGWLARLAAGIDAVQAQLSPIGEVVSMTDKGFTADLFMWRRHEDFRAFVFESPMAHLARQAMGSHTVTHWYDQLFVKEPGSEVPTPWHHDLTFWPDIDAARSDFDLLSWEMEPGDVLLFHPLIVHGSSGNRSRTTRRRALASRWAGDDVVYDPRPHTMPIPPKHGLEPGEHLGGPIFPLVLGQA